MPLHPKLLPRVYIVGPTARHVRDVQTVLRQLKRDRGLEFETQTFLGFDEVGPHLQRYVNLVVFNYRGVPADDFKGSLHAFREEYSGRMVIVNEDPSVHPCIWGRFYGMNYHAPTVAELKPYIERSFSRPHPRGRTAIVFAGGGILGGFTEIGVYKALYDLGLREYDMYIGLSAGAYVATVAAHRIPPRHMIEHRGLGLTDFYNPNVEEALKKALFFLPNLVAGTAKYLRNPTRDILFLLSSLLPTSPLSGRRIAKTLAKQLADAGGTDSFLELRKRGVELYITAMDLDSTALRVFGVENDMDVPISEAVSASAALPLAYKPVEIDGRHYIDGGIHTTANIDVAIQRGADLIVCVNPLVPYVAEEAGTIERMGALGIVEQSYRTLLHRRLHRDLEYYKRAHPKCLVLLIEPNLYDENVFHNPLYANAELIDLAVVQGYEAARRYMERDWDFVQRSFHYHGRPISRAIVDRVSRALKQTELSHQTLVDVFAAEAEA